MTFSYLQMIPTSNYEAESPKELESKLNKGLKELHTWLIVNRLSLNIEKTNFVVFHPYNKQLKRTITQKIQKKGITEKDAVKYIGIMIDSGLRWKSHLDILSKKLSRAIGQCTRLDHVLTLLF